MAGIGIAFIGGRVAASGIEPHTTTTTIQTRDQRHPHNNFTPNRTNNTNLLILQMMKPLASAAALISLAADALAASTPLVELYNNSDHGFHRDGLLNHGKQAAILLYSHIRMSPHSLTSSRLV